MIGYYDYTVFATFLSAACAALGIRSAVNGEALAAVFCLIVCGGLDLIDGPIARTKKNRTKAECRNGIQIDSLSDILAFCALPSSIAVCLCDHWLSTVSAVAVTVCGLIRLAYFNVTEEERQDETTEHRKEYLGMPVTTVAITFPIAYAVASKTAGKYLLLPAVLIVSAALFVTPIRVKKLHGKACLAVGVVGLVLLAVLFFVR